MFVFENETKALTRGGLQGFTTFDDVFAAVRDAKVQFGIVPIENSYR